jgi:hypothetical protein
VKDIDNDGKVEIIFGDNAFNMHVLNASGQEKSGWPRRVNAWIQSDPAFGDIDGDGIGEIVCGTGWVSGGEIYAWEISGEVVTGFPVLVGGSEVNVNLNDGVTLEDINGDDKLEIFIKGQADSNDYYIALDGKGNPLDGWPIVKRGDPVFSGCKPLVADITGDGQKKIIALNSDGKLYAFGIDATVLPGWPRQIGRGNYIDPLGIDLDGDGVLNVVAGGFAFRGNGTSLPGWPLSSPRSGYYGSAVAADLTGDREPEIILVNQHGHSLAVVQPDGTFLNGWPIKTLSQPSATPLVADVDGDFENEIIVALGYPAQIAAYNPDGTLVSEWPYVIAGDSFHVSTPTIFDIEGGFQLGRGLWNLQKYI